MFVNTTAHLESTNRVVIDTEIQARGYEERAKLPKPWWAVVSAAFLINSGKEKCVILVRRTPHVDFGERWALLPAGGSDTVEELRHPGLTLERETREELRLYMDEKEINPLKNSRLLTKNKIEIHDLSTGRTHQEIGVLHLTDKQLFLMRIYELLLNLDDVVIYDGEQSEQGTYLDRLISVVPLSKLEGKVMPVNLFKSKKRQKTMEIDLSGYQTPTLDWLRKIDFTLGVN